MGAAVEKPTKDRVRYEIVRVFRDDGGEWPTWTVPHSTARSLDEAIEIAKRDLVHWLIVERRVVASSEKPEGA